MSLAGHCAGLFQTIRDEGVDEEGRGALNFLGGLVQVVDDSANDELEVHVGKQPNLTDLFTLSDSAPNLTIGVSGSLLQLLDRVGVNVTPTNAERLSLSEASGNIAPTGTDYRTFRAALTSTLAKSLTAYGNLLLSGTLSMAGFNITSFLGLFFGPTAEASGGASSTITDYDAIRLGGSVRGDVNGVNTLTVTNLAYLRTGAGSHGFGGRLTTITTLRGVWIRRPGLNTDLTTTTHVGLEIDDLITGSNDALTTYSIRVQGDAASIHQPAMTIGANAAPTAAHVLDVRGDFRSTGKLTTYDNLPVEGKGVPAIHDVRALTAQVAAIGSTNFDNGGVAGLYRVWYYLVVTTADAAAGTIRCDVTFNDGTAARTLTGVTIALTATNKGNLWTNADIDGSIIRLGSGNIAFSTTLTGAIGTAQYSLYIGLERLS